MRKLLVTLFVSAFALLGAAAHAAHNTVTVGVISSTRDAITGTVRVRNTTAALTETGTLTLVVLQVKEDGRVEERDRQNLGTFTVAGGTSSPLIPYTVDTSRGLFKKGAFIILADFNTPPVAHTHCGTLTVIRDF